MPRPGPWATGNERRGSGVLLNDPAVGVRVLQRYPVAPRGG